MRVVVVVHFVIVQRGFISCILPHTNLPFLQIQVAGRLMMLLSVCMYYDIRDEGSVGRLLRGTNETVVGKRPTFIGVHVRLLTRNLPRNLVISTNPSRDELSKSPNPTASNPDEEQAGSASHLLS